MAINRHKPSYSRYMVANEASVEDISERTQKSTPITSNKRLIPKFKIILNP